MAGEALQRPALAQRVGLSKLAVSELLAALEVQGLVTVAGALGGVPGRSQLTYELKADAALAVGFDVGGTKTAGAVSDLRGRVLVELTEPTAREGAEALIAQLVRMVEAMCGGAGLSRLRLRSVAVGVPAAVHPLTAEQTLAGNLPGLEGGNLRDRLAAALELPVVVDNDVNLALLSEVSRGSARDSKNVAFVALGTGIGGALLINGHLLHGANGGAGEIGYLPLWRIDSPGAAPLEDRVGEAGIRKAYVAEGGDRQHTVRDIFDEAGKGSAAAIAALGRASEDVARAVLSLLAMLDPDLVVLGGSIGSRPEFIASVERHVLAAWTREIAIVGSQGGGRAGLLGALELARGTMLDHLFGSLPAR